jgi:hypothetical protein
VLLRGLSAVEPYLDEIVVAGGWVPHVYELLYDAAKAGRSPRTRDIDLAVPRSIPVKEKSIDALLTEANFKCEFTSITTPPVTKYFATDGDDIEIEFITDAPGGPEAVVSVQPDLTAQELHYVGLLLQEPWSVDAADIGGGSANFTFFVPAPAAYIFHKSLVFRDRTDRLKREKDLYYVFFILEAFPEWEGLVQDGLTQLAVTKAAWFKKSRKNLAEIFQSAEFVGVDALLNQRPSTAFPGLNDDQFRQYAHAVMSSLIEMMDVALGG